MGEMPKHSEVDKRPQVAFLTWWHSKYFLTNDKYRPLYRIYEELHRSGASLDSIDMLIGILSLGDSITAMLRGSGARPKRRHVRTRHVLPEISDLRIGEVLTLDQKAKQSWKSLLEVLSKVDKTLHEFAQSFTRSPALPALLKFCVLDQFRFTKVGQRSDLWGSFFLLLVTEYLRMELGREHYREADKLLRACRILNGQIEKASEHAQGKASQKKREKWTAAKRIEKLKRSHPTWLDAVTPILLQLQLITKGESQRYRANTRSFVQRWVSEKPLTQKFLHELARRRHFS